MKGTDIFEKILIDDVEVDISLIDAQGGKFHMPAGNHKVEYVLKVKHTIPDNLFKNISNMKNVVLPKLVTFIGQHTFENTGITDQDTIDTIHNINEDAIVGENDQPTSEGYYYGTYAGTEDHFNVAEAPGGTYPVSIKDADGLDSCNDFGEIGQISLGNASYTYLVIPKDFYDASYEDQNAKFTDGTNHYTLGDNLTDMAIQPSNVFDLDEFEGHEYYAILWFGVSGNVWFKLQQ